MVTIDGIGSLNLVKFEIDNTLKQAETAIELYAEEPDNEAQLKTAIELFCQIRGIFRMIGLPAATMLISEMEILAKDIFDGVASDNEAQLASMGNAIVILSHYLEYIHIKQCIFPALLIPTINELRLLSKKSYVPESSFFNVDLNVVRDFTVKKPNTVESSDIPALSRRLRLMYQVGMLGVFKGENPKTNFRLMRRALEQIDKLCGDVPIGSLWWVAKGAMEAFATETIEITNVRKTFLGRIDRHIRLLVQQGAEVLEQEPPEHLLKECLYFVSLASKDDDHIVELRKAFSLDTNTYTDEVLVQERDLMCGPGGTVIQTVASALQEDLSQIKDSLDQGARGAQGGKEGLGAVKEALVRTSQTLVMLGLMDPSNVLRDLADRIHGWEDREVEAEEYNAVADSLLFVENAIIELRNANTPQTHSEIEVDKDVTISLSQLEEARQVVVAESRAGLSLAKRAISSYVDSHWDGMHLNNVPVTLHSVWGGLVFLQLERAAKVMTSCGSYVGKDLIDGSQGKPDEHMMDTLADALTSIDYYLESMEENKPIGDGILDVAEESVLELGYPITALAS